MCKVQLFGILLKVAKKAKKKKAVALTLLSHYPALQMNVEFTFFTFTPHSLSHYVVFIHTATELQKERKNISGLF